MSERLTRRAALRTMAGAVALLPALLAAKPVAAETVAVVAIDPTDIMPGTVTMEWGDNRWEGGSLAIVGETGPEIVRLPSCANCTAFACADCHVALAEIF